MLQVRALGMIPAAEGTLPLRAQLGLCGWVVRQRVLRQAHKHRCTSLLTAWRAVAAPALPQPGRWVRKLGHGCPGRQETVAPRPVPGHQPGWQGQRAGGLDGSAALPTRAPPGCRSAVAGPPGWSLAVWMRRPVFEHRTHRNKGEKRYLGQNGPGTTQPQARAWTTCMLANTGVSQHGVPCTQILAAISLPSRPGPTDWSCRGDRSVSNTLTIGEEGASPRGLLSGPLSVNVSIAPTTSSSLSNSTPWTSKISAEQRWLRGGIMIAEEPWPSKTIRDEF